MNEDAFLSALHESPDDEVTWLALADWLDEDGQPLRAELVRLVRRLRAMPHRTRTKKRAAVEDRVAGLLADGVRPVVAEVVNSIDMRLALFPAGRFRMGSPQDETMRGHDERAHSVRIDRPFYLGVFPVTQEQYQQVIGSNPASYRHNGTNADVVVGLDTSAFPVECISWDDAVAFCRALSERKGEKEARRVYRLPTEAEWEYASRAAGTSLAPFSFGQSLSSRQANFDGNHPYGGAEQGPNLRRPSEVGSYRPNCWGLYDVCGNVWEWCEDAYAPYETQAEGQPSNSRVVRGGACYNYAAWCRSARRGSVGPAQRYPHVGFRVAADWPITSSAGRDR